ncbi:MAG: hypothetical protein ABJL99_09235 [Aliishimia sp.]
MATIVRIAVIGDGFHGTNLDADADADADAANDCKELEGEVLISRCARSLRD